MRIALQALQQRGFVDIGRGLDIDAVDQLDRRPAARIPGAPDDVQPLQLGFGDAEPGRDGRT
jgi:hypothetical protein